MIFHQDQEQVLWCRRGIGARPQECEACARGERSGFEPFSKGGCGSRPDVLRRARAPRSLNGLVPFAGCSGRNFDHDGLGLAPRLFFRSRGSAKRGTGGPNRRQRPPVPSPRQPTRGLSCLQLWRAGSFIAGGWRPSLRLAAAERARYEGIGICSAAHCATPSSCIPIGAGRALCRRRR